MSTTSKLPGRLRLEIKELINKKCHCRVLELKILEIIGVTEAEANHRTGRLLAVFDEEVINSRELVLRIREILDETTECHDNASWAEHRESSINRNTKQYSGFVHAVIDIAGHMFMPKPLNILLPIAVNAFRKNI